MHLSRIRIKNYRNFVDLDLRLAEGAVLVGENAVGKSNLLCALGLILDPALSDAGRELRDEDFWDGYVSPRADGVPVEVSVELTGFDSASERDRRAQALLADFLVARNPYIARLTYVSRPRADLTRPPASPADYEFLVYGGTDEAMEVRYDTRHRLGFEVFRALRDAERALASWRRSPLRPLLTDVLRDIPRDRLAGYAQAVDGAARAVTDAGEVRELAERIRARIARMVGDTHALSTTLGLAPSDPESLFRSLRLFVDERLRDVSEASVGSANVLYLALVALGIEHATAAGERVHTILGVEEPEAHLHPHVQRLVYRDFLRRRAHQGAGRAAETPDAAGSGDAADGSDALSRLLTTHSPHIVSVAPVRSLAVLRRTALGPAGNAAAAPAVRPGALATVGRSAAQLTLDTREEADLERYLDVSRGELVFARGLVFVEGEAEAYVVPALAAHCGYDLDQLGISVCSVAGTHFTPFLKLVGPTGLDIPAVVLTDWDPAGDPDAGEDDDGDDDGTGGADVATGTASAAPPSYGARRIVGTLAALGADAVPDARDAAAVRAAAAAAGVFANEHTFEVDLFRAGNGAVFTAALAECGAGSRTRARLTAWASNPSALDAAQFLRAIERIGKGRVAQTVARHLLAAARTAPSRAVVPQYIADALAHLVARLPAVPVA